LRSGVISFGRAPLGLEDWRRSIGIGFDGVSSGRLPSHRYSPRRSMSGHRDGPGLFESRDLLPEDRVVGHDLLVRDFEVLNAAVETLILSLDEVQGLDPVVSLLLLPAEAGLAGRLGAFEVRRGLEALARGADSTGSLALLVGSREPLELRECTLRAFPGIRLRLEHPQKRSGFRDGLGRVESLGADEATRTSENGAELGLLGGARGHHAHCRSGRGGIAHHRRGPLRPVDPFGGDLDCRCLLACLRAEVLQEALVLLRDADVLLLDLRHRFLR